MFKHTTSIATVCLSGTLPTKLRAIAAAGFESIELFEDDLLRYPGSLADVRRMCEELGLSICLYQPFRDLEGCATKREFRMTLERFELRLQWMKELGVDMILVVSNCRSDAHNDFKRWVSELRSAADMAADYGVKIAYEALAWGTHINLWRQSSDLVKAVDRDNFGLCLDTFHIFCRQDTLDGMSHIPGEKIFILQLADAPLMKMDVLEWSRHHRCFPGQGELDILYFMAELEKTGYKGVLSLEVFNDYLRNTPPEKMAADGIRSLRWLEAEMYGPSACPPAPKSMRIEFLEFAVCRSEIPSMSSFFATLGFTKSRKHRTKDVQWYSNGSVSLVLNAHPNPHGEKYYRSHGSSLCALALRVDTATPTIARAKALGYEIVPPCTLGLGEADVTAVKTPDGMLIYIVDSDSSWGQDFIPCRSSTPVNGVYTGVDHIIISTTVEEMLGLKLCYRALFGMDMRKEMDVVDPHGLVTSWSLGNGEFRILLCSSDSPRAVVRRGKGVVGVSLRTDNAFAAAARFKTIASSGPGGRYYEDLSGRYQISTELMKKLESKGLLYEEDGNCGKWQGCFTGWKALGGCWWGLAERDCFEGYPMVSLGAQMACLQQQEVERRESVVEKRENVTEPTGKAMQLVTTVGWRVWAELARI